MKKLTLIAGLLVVGAMVCAPLAWTITQPYGGGGGTNPGNPGNPYTGELGRHEVIHIWYTRDEAGRLIGQSGTIIADGVDIDGNNYHMETTLTYEILNGRALLKHSYTETHAWNEDGSESWSQRNVYYEHDGDGTLIGASGDTYTHGYGADIVDEGVEKRGAYYETNSTQEYAIIEGAAQVISSEAETYTYLDDTKATNIGYSTSTTTYEYEVILGVARLKTATTDTYSEDRQNFDPEGNPGIRNEHIVITYEYNDVGSLIGASGTGSAAGTELTADGWMSYTSDITILFSIYNGVARQDERIEDKTSTPLDANAPTVDPQVTGKLLSFNETVVDGQRIYTAIIQDAEGNLWLLKLSAAAYNQLQAYGAGSTVTINGDIEDGRILINVVVH